MRKSELKPGMVVETRLGNKYAVMGDNWVRHTGYVTADSYYEDLRSNNDDSQWDIMYVYKADCLSFAEMFAPRHLELIWSREPDVDEITQIQLETIQAFVDYHSHCSERSCPNPMRGDGTDCVRCTADYMTEQIIREQNDKYGSNKEKMSI